jgi:hypothetical protein
VTQRGQSTVEPMIALTVTLLSLACFAYVRHDLFVELVAFIFDWVGSRIDLP